MAPERHRWVVDSVEEGIAALEEDGERLIHLPAWLLPRGAREGAILSAEREHAAKESSVIRIRVDEDASRDVQRISRERRSSGGDEGGNIKL
jgi:hypothetical protein